MKNFKMSKEQVTTIAWNIFADIDLYVKEHAEEFEAFLKCEEEGGKDYE